MPQLILRPVKDILDINNAMSYSNSYGAWNTIIFPSLILRKFPQLKDRGGIFGYRMILHETIEELQHDIDNIKDKGEALPILLWIYQESIQQ
jgi:hypothetical protein